MIFFSLLYFMGKEIYIINIIYIECDKYFERSVKGIMRGQGSGKCIFNWSRKGFIVVVFEQDFERWREIGFNG